MLYISLSINSINESLQVGDLVFYTPLGNSSGGFDFSNNPPLLFGEVVEILNNEIIVLYDDQNNPNAIPQNQTDVYPGDYIMFAKNKVVNTSKLKGYYLEAEFVNNSKSKAELFSVGSQIYESSK
jgi:hypothetical protein